MPLPSKVIIVKRCSKEVEENKWGSQEKKVCRGPFQEVLIDKLQSRGWQSGSPAGAEVVKGTAELAAGLPGIGVPRRHGSLGEEVCLVTTGPAARRTAVTTDAASWLEEVGSETLASVSAMSSFEQRKNIKFCEKLKRSITETLALMNEAYED
ncbi:hypothetical protein LAZ67_9002222 [Cordylochernes scorpioides]|uniref:Uncharacterized protein n=1 Tax=Cordylochernes scorpioides TaxID=51811 RepID=A0ABY6KXB5_9ARAC|nr:hypothetical protein LAZ67_9002222 [Cordylochernes scorpioides]